MSNALRFEQVRKTFGPVTVADGVDLVVPEGAYLCLLGPSGCGKTTLLRMAAGLTIPDAGRIVIGSRDVTALEPGDRRIGMAFQNYALYPQHNVFENLAFPFRAKLRRKRYNEAEIGRQVRRIAQLLRIEPILDRSVGEISGGQKQRVALGRALIRDPEVLLLDEPITHLDARLRFEMRTELKRLHLSIGTTALHVTHDQQEAMALSDLIALMKDGRIVQVGTPDEIYSLPANSFVARFIGDPPMSILNGRLQASTLDIAGSSYDLPPHLTAVREKIEDSLVDIGIRGSAIAVTEAVEGKLVAKVVSHENVGPEVELTAESDAGTIKFRIRGSSHYSIGARIGVILDLSAACLFDAKSGRRLS